MWRRTRRFGDGRDGQISLIPDTLSSSSLPSSLSSSPSSLPNSPVRPPLSTPHVSPAIPVSSSGPASASELESKPIDLVEGFLASLNDDTDLTIKLDDFTWKVHSKLMAARSPFFEALCSGRWRESNDHTVELHDDNPRVFARFLQFIYCDDYQGNLIGVRSACIKQQLTLQKLLGTDKTAAPYGKNDVLKETTNYRVVHFEVYELADKYGCQDLQSLARSNIARDCGGSEIGNLRAMMHHRDLGGWRNVIDADNSLKEIFAQKFARNYRAMKSSAEEEEECEADESTQEEKVEEKRMGNPLKEWLRWLEEDNAFCLMVVDAMSK